MYIAGYRINVQKSVVFLYNGNELWEKLRKIPFTITSKRIKHLGINQGGKDLCPENY